MGRYGKSNLSPSVSSLNTPFCGNIRPVDDQRGTWLADPSYTESLAASHKDAHIIICYAGATAIPRGMR